MVSGSQCTGESTLFAIEVVDVNHQLNIDLIIVYTTKMIQAD
jgi:hypothetical protein